MRELNVNEIEQVDGGIIWWKALEVALVAIGTADAVRDAYNGYNDGYDSVNGDQ